MHKQQVYVFKRGYMIKGDENEAEHEKSITKIRLEITTWRKHGHKYTKCKMCVTIMIVICIK